MKKYTTPSIKVITAFATDIIQTSEVTETAMPKSVIQGVGGTEVTATGYGSSDFSGIYGITNVAE